MELQLLIQYWTFKLEYKKWNEKIKVTLKRSLKLNALQTLKYVDMIGKCKLQLTCNAGFSF